MEIVVHHIAYIVERNVKDALDVSELEEKLTDYFEPYDFILGDYAYGKLRLKGFNSKENKNYRPINDIANLDTYVANYCAYGCRYFVISKVKDLK